MVFLFDIIQDKIVISEMGLKVQVVKETFLIFSLIWHIVQVHFYLCFQ